MEERNILCIDLKSFFASVECIEIGLDPFTTPLVVTDKSRGNGAITLAVTPYLKNFGVKSRGRVYELPKNIDIIFARPRMNLYLKKSSEIVNIYLDFISEEDMHIYSIDEVFLDVTDYLSYYKMSDYELAKVIMKAIKDKTGITSTCGIGPNMLLAKVALDIESKHSKDFISKWTHLDVKTKLWEITPLSEMWGIGKRTEKKLNSLGIKKVGDISKYGIDFYKKRFGIMGEELWNHAHGIDLSNIKKEKIRPKEKSYGTSQILYRDYKKDEVPLIIKEMVGSLASRLRANKKMCNIIYLGIGYSRTYGGGFGHSKKLIHFTDDENIIFEICEYFFNTYIEDLPIRRVSIALGGIQEKGYMQLNLFENPLTQVKKDDFFKAVDEIKLKYGKNAILKASSLLGNSTIRKRNTIVGGHNSE